MNHHLLLQKQYSNFDQNLFRSFVGKIVAIVIRAYLDTQKRETMP